ncbi:MAG: class I SAM-dependent methyltransferase [Desulfocapsa sp.]|nr:class I SAM-dependent methyltransferase [Desulfocapsa sp.]
MEEISEDFYEEYGDQWASTGRGDLEKLTSLYKVTNLCSLMEGLELKRIVDFGCGLGDALDILFKTLKPEEAVGIDISSKMVAHARKRYPDYRFMDGDFTLLNEFQADLITFIDVLEHIDDIPQVLNLAKQHAKYIAVKIPLEKTWFIAALNNLHLKENKSRLFESEGHLYEFNQKEVDDILEQSGLEIVNRKVDFVPPKVHFSDYMKSRMQAKTGILGKVKYYLYLMLSKAPYTITRPLFEIVNGVDYFVLCKT